MPTVKVTCHTGHGRMSNEGYDSLVFNAVYLNDDGSRMPFDSSMENYLLNVWVDDQFWGTSGRAGINGDISVFTTFKDQGAPSAKPGQSLKFEVVEDTGSTIEPTKYEVDSGSHKNLSTSMSY